MSGIVLMAIVIMQGQVIIKGRARKGLLADDKELASQLKVGMVFQNGALFDSLNVQENVGFMLYEHSDLPDDRIEVPLQLCLLPHPFTPSSQTWCTVQDALAGLLCWVPDKACLAMDFH